MIGALMRPAGRFAAWLRGAYPPLAGLFEGTLALFFVAFALGLSGPLVVAPAWPVLVWAAMAFRRALGYQFASALVLGLGMDFLSAGATGGSLGMMAGALAVANAFDSPLDSRWSGGHLVFALAAVGGGWITSVMLALVGPVGYGPWPGFGQLGASLLALTVVSFAGLILHVMMERRRQQRAIAGGGIGAASWRRVG